MIIEINTEEQNITEHPQGSDEELTSRELETQVATGIAALMAGQAIKHYKSDKARNMYLLMLVDIAYKTLERAKEEGETKWEE